MPTPIARAALLVGCVVVLASAASGATTKKSLDTVPPRPPREFRGAWIATVANLDWPSKPGLTTAQQQAELLSLLDRAGELNLNVVILQVRPACDTLYSSTLEPWSEFLSGHMGKAPEPYYDPLAFAVEEAHRRGLELHAWFNPFRVRAANPKTGLATNYISRLHPAYVRTYGSQQWLDPGLKEVRDHTTRVILDVVKRYDIDGVHLDDYFYPYPEKNAAGQLLDFPDDASWSAYTKAGGRLSRGDWRRKNIDDFIQTLYQKTKAEKRWVKVGLSPFGIWRPGFPKQVQKGLDAYEHLYADSRKWLAHGWGDYFSPQLYWSVEARDQSYPALLEWWTRQNPKARLICPGSDTTKVGGPWNSAEIVRQIHLARKQTGAHGHVLWSLGAVARNADQLSDALRKEVYGTPALPPATPWLGGAAPPKPKVTVRLESPGKPGAISWNDSSNGSAWRWLYQSRANGRWSARILTKDQTSVELPRRGSAAFPESIAVTPVDRCGIAGPTAVIAERQLTPPAPATSPTNSLASRSPTTK